LIDRKRKVAEALLIVGIAALAGCLLAAAAGLLN
jgi:hypothetical protein